MISYGFVFFSDDSCPNYCITRSMATGNQGHSECTVSPQATTSDGKSLTSDDDLLRANCCAAGSPVPYVHCEYCSSTTGIGSCTTFTNANRTIAKLEVTGADLPAGNGFLRCMAEYLDVSKELWRISLNVKRTDDGKTPVSMCGDDIANSELLLQSHTDDVRRS